MGIGGDNFKLCYILVGKPRETHGNTTKSSILKYYIIDEFCVARGKLKAVGDHTAAGVRLCFYFARRGTFTPVSQLTEGGALYECIDSL